MAVKHIPDGYHEVTPFIIAEGASELIDFLTSAFGARERLRMPAPKDKVGHAEVVIGNSVIMVADPSPAEKAASACIHLYVDDVDRVFQQATAAGAVTSHGPQDQFYGDRMATVHDKWGNCWYIATHIEDVSAEDMMKRMAAMAQT